MWFLRGRAVAAALMLCDAALAQPIEHTLGSFEVPGACPAVPVYAQQMKQDRALSWKPGKVLIEARLSTRERVVDRQSRLQLRDCTVMASQALPKELLVAASTAAEQALVDGVNSCLQKGRSAVQVQAASLRRGAPDCR